jgi:hypothetical protein
LTEAFFFFFFLNVLACRQSISFNSRSISSWIGQLPQGRTTAALCGAWRTLDETDWYEPNHQTRTRVGALLSRSGLLNDFDISSTHAAAVWHQVVCTLLADTATCRWLFGGMIAAANELSSGAEDNSRAVLHFSSNNEFIGPREFMMLRVGGYISDKLVESCLSALASRLSFSPCVSIFRPAFLPKLVDTSFLSRGITSKNVGSIRPLHLVPPASTGALPGHDFVEVHQVLRDSGCFLFPLFVSPPRQCPGAAGTSRSQSGIGHWVLYRVNLLPDRRASFQLYDSLGCISLVEWASDNVHYADAIKEFISFATGPGQQFQWDDLAPDSWLQSDTTECGAVVVAYAAMLVSVSYDAYEPCSMHVSSIGIAC